VSGFAVEAGARPARPSFWKLLWAVLAGYLGASLSLGLLALGLAALGLLPQPFRRPGPFPVTGAWSLDADLVVAVASVLVAAWWIRMMVADETGTPVSFGVVALVVAGTGFAPFLALRPVALTGLAALPLTAWLVGRFAVGRELPLPRPSWRVWASAAVLGALVFASYRVYHPLSSPGGGSGVGRKGREFRVFDIRNSGFANLTILRVDGGVLGDWLSAPSRLPHTLRSHSGTSVFVRGSTCLPRTVEVTFSVLGRTSTQQFAVAPSACRG
jgi:hypothetical protein